MDLGERFLHCFTETFCRLDTPLAGFRSCRGIKGLLRHRIRETRNRTPIVDRCLSALGLELVQDFTSCVACLSSRSSL